MAETSENIPKTIFVCMEDEVQPHILAGMLSRNISQVYNWAQNGKILNVKKSDPNYKPVTYKEVLKHLIDSLIKEDAMYSKFIRRNEKRSLNVGDFDDDDSIHPLVAAKIQQQIKKEYAMESQIWQTIAIKNEEYVNFAKKLAIVEPFMIQIRDLLLGIALDYPEVREVIDEGMENLHAMGIKLIEEARIDREDFVETMLNKSLDEIKNSDD